MENFAAECVSAYMRAHPDAPAVVEFRAALAGLLNEIAAIDDPFDRTAEAIKAFGKRGPGMVEELLRRSAEDDDSSR